MSRNLDKVIKSGKLTGEEIGKLMINDLIAAYEEAAIDKDVASGKKDSKAILNVPQINAMVEGLKTSEDIRAYNDYRALHDYLGRSYILATIHLQSVEIAYWKLHTITSELLHAEEENQRFIDCSPKLMTQKQYDDWKVIEGAGETYLGGVAILQTPTNNIDERGYYTEPEPYWNKRYMAEFVIDSKKELMEYLISEINHNIREALIVKESVKLLSEYVGIPEMNKIQPSLDFFGNIPCYNDFISLIPYSMSRFGRYKNERSLEELKKEIDDVFRPFELEALYPTKEAIEKAKGIINLNIIKGRIEDLFEVLRGEA